jgi:hypothetical protein
MEMNNKAKKKLIIIFALIAINVVGFTSARYYFSLQPTTDELPTGLLKKFTQSSPEVISPSKFLEIGLELLQNLGK